MKFQLGRRRTPSPWLRLCSKRGKQKKCTQIFWEVSGVFQWNFNCSKNSAVLEPRTGQFSRTWGFEAKAKAKDLTFEAKAKAKDFKMCSRGRPRGRPRGQGRPRELHLWGLPQFSKPLGLLWFWREDQNSEFPKTFFGETSFCICWISLQPQSQN